MKNTPFIYVPAVQSEQEVIDKVTLDFVLAFMSKDLKLMKSILDPNGKFLGSKNSWEFLAWLRKQFDVKVPEDKFCQNLPEYLCLDMPWPGRGIMIFGGYMPMVTTDPRPKIVYLRILNGKICDIRLSYDFIEMHEVNELVKKN